MKKVLFIVCLLIPTFATLAQENRADGKRMRYGFNLGVNYSNVLDNDELPDNATLVNGIGFRMGLLADIRVFDFLSVSPKSELSFNNSKVKFTNPDGSSSSYDVMPISLDLMTHFTFKKHNSNLKPYFFFGPDVKIPVSKKPEDTTRYYTNPDVAIDLGIGAEKPLTRFSFLPELRYSFGLLNVNQHPQLKSLNVHTISLVLNFLG